MKSNIKQLSDERLSFARHRRLRQSESLRSMVRETRVVKSDLIQPLFIVPGKGIRKEISSLVNQFHLSVDETLKEAESLLKLGVTNVLLFGVPNVKDETGSSSCNHDGIVQTAVRALKKELPELTITVDVCFCEYTTHGHCGILKGQTVDNDLTLEMLDKQAVSLAEAGADIIAPSGMMDGTIVSLRAALDNTGFEDKILMSYAAKYASAFYGPFREAVASTPSFGDRRTHQMDPANSDEALREIASDIEQGADIVMIKPALAYLDVISRVRDSFNIPIAAYNVSGEYAMIKLAAEKGLIDGEKAMLECLTSIKRAGAGIIITYFAKEAAAII
jgi:porphobilinogen synthase